MLEFSGNNRLISSLVLNRAIVLGNVPTFQILLLYALQGQPFKAKLIATNGEVVVAEFPFALAEGAGKEWGRGLRSSQNAARGPFCNSKLFPPVLE